MWPSLEVETSQGGGEEVGVSHRLWVIDERGQRGG
jgi:hypothetical protein